MLLNIGYKFKDVLILEKALTHATAGRGISYERIEFLGDRILSFIIAEILFNKFPKADEGLLSKYSASLVKKDSLIAVANTIGIQNHIIANSSIKNAVNSGEQTKILADCCEAIIAAIYIDGGLESTVKFISNYWKDMIDNVEEEPTSYKVALQEWAQKNSFELPLYNLELTGGSAHNPLFTAEISLNSKVEKGTGKTRKDAEQDAAKNYMEKYIKWNQ